MSHRKTQCRKKVAWKLEDKDGKKIATIFPVKIVAEKTVDEIEVRKHDSRRKKRNDSFPSELFQGL